MLNLSEIFCSIQGESSYAGLPCIFVRLAGCNLRCIYCDSEYSYFASFSMEIPQIIKEISKFKPVKLVEVTGGEPLLQEETFQLLRLLTEQKHTVLLETNGSISLREVHPAVIKIIDLKCPGSGYPESFLEDNLKFINTEKDEIKFVLTDRNDYDWAKQKIEKLSLNDNNLIFSPAFSLLDPQVLADWIVADKLNVRMQLQLHKYIWDPNRQGV